MFVSCGRFCGNGTTRGVQVGGMATSPGGRFSACQMDACARVLQTGRTNTSFVKRHAIPDHYTNPNPTQT